MEEAENKDVIEQEIIEPAKAESSSNQPEVSNETPKEPETGSKDYNWRQLEDKHTKETDQFKRKIWALEQENQQIALKKEQESEDIQLEKDDLITYGQVDEIIEKRAEKKARAIFQDEFQKVEKAKQPAMAKQKYSDFEEIVTNENIKKLEKEDPELTRLIVLSNDPYERTYKEIKRSKFYKSTQSNKESSEKIAENSKKPVSSNSFGKQRPLSYANDYAKGDKSLWEDMQKLRGGSI